MESTFLDDMLLASCYEVLANVSYAKQSQREPQNMGDTQHLRILSLQSNVSLTLHFMFS